MNKPILVSSPRFWSLVRGYQLDRMTISYMSLNQGPECNRQCEQCFRYPARKSGVTDGLTMPEYTRLIDEFHRFGGLALEISGEGEPGISLNTMPIIQSATSKGLWTTLITNGDWLTGAIVEELKELRVALVISLHSLKPEIYEKDCGVPGSFTQAMKTIDLVAKIFEDTGWEENSWNVKRVAIHWTLQANNLEEVPKARLFCDEKRFLFSIAPIAKVGHATNRPELWLSTTANLKEINELGDESIIFYDEPDGRLVCGTCRYGLNIGCDGKLLLDAHGGYEAELPNIRNISFSEAIRIQKVFSKTMFEKLSSFCPVRDPDWGKFLAQKEYLVGLEI